VCAFGTCGEPSFDAGPPPPTCTQPVPTMCDACFVAACCAQLGACEADPQCNKSLACFNSCYVPGSGNAASCASQCNDASGTGTAFNQCAIQACAGSCN
jgi:hypothetical protein